MKSLFRPLIFFLFFFPCLFFFSPFLPLSDPPFHSSLHPPPQKKQCLEVTLSSLLRTPRTAKDCTQAPLLQHALLSFKPFPCFTIKQVIFTGLEPVTLLYWDSVFSSLNGIIKLILHLSIKDKQSPPFFSWFFFHQKLCVAKNVVRYWMGETSGQISFVGLHGDRASTPNESQEKAYLGQLLFCSPLGPHLDAGECIFSQQSLCIFTVLSWVDRGTWSDYILLTAFLFFFPLCISTLGPILSFLGTCPN